MGIVRKFFVAADEEGKVELWTKKKERMDKTNRSLEDMMTKRVMADYLGYVYKKARYVE